MRNAHGARPDTDFTREILARAGVSLNEAVNGVFLPAVKGYIGEAANHLTLHTNDYYNSVNKALSNAATREEVGQALSAIKE